MGNQSVYVIAQFGSHREELFAPGWLSWPESLRQISTVWPWMLITGKTTGMPIFISPGMAEYPDFFKNDASAYYSASSLEKLDMRKSALKPILI